MPAIKSVVVPADAAKPLRVEELQRNDLDHMMALVGGYLEVVNIVRPPCSLIVNEEGRQRRLPVNERATLILRALRREFIGEDRLLGDCFIVGHPDSRGNDRSAPAELIAVLTEGKALTIEVQLTEGADWLRPDGITYPDWQAAYKQAVHIASRWGLIEAVRVVQAQ